MSDKWIRTKSKPQPFIQVQATLCPKDYSDLGFCLHIPATSVILTGMADTGCQSCLAGIKAISPLDLSRDYLIPVTMKMHAANNAGISILGAVILRFSGTASLASS